MAVNSLTVTDVYAIVNAAAASMYGAENTTTVKDTSSFVTVGEQMLRTGYEDTFKAISHVLGSTVIDVRPYKGEFFLISSFTDSFAIASRKISFFTKKAEASGNFNTDIASTQLNDGQSIDHYTISKKYPVELDWTGAKTLEYSYTTFRNQIKIAFQNEANFAAFVAGMLVAIANDIEHIKGAENMLQVINYIGACVDTTKEETAFMSENLVKSYNESRGVVKTAAELKDTQDFLAYLVEWLQTKIARFKIDSVENHVIPYAEDDAGNELTLLRHTPVANQRLLFYEPFMRRAKATIMPAVFNDQYLNISNYEGVEYWQNLANPSEVFVKPSYLEPDSTSSKLLAAEGAPVNIKNMLGILFDDQAVWTRYMLDFVNVTPVNAKGDYYNTYFHWLKQHCCDLSQKGIAFYADDYLVPASTAVTSGTGVLVDTNLTDDDITATSGYTVEIADGEITITGNAGKCVVSGANLAPIEFTVS